MEVNDQLHQPATLPPTKESVVATGYEAGWSPEPILKKRKISSQRPDRMRCKLLGINEFVIYTSSSNFVIMQQ
jgi:hypothetical protein